MSDKLFISQDQKIIMGIDLCKPGYQDMNALVIMKVEENGTHRIVECETELDPDKFERMVNYFKTQYEVKTDPFDQIAYVELQAKMKDIRKQNEKGERCPQCKKYSVFGSGGGGVRCKTPGCGYWECF
jgi:hypothetical protein